MLLQMLQMGLDGVGALPDDVLHHLALIVGFGLPFDDLNRAQRTLADAGAKAIAEEVADQPRLAVDQLECPFRAVGDAFAAAVAFRFIDLDNFSLHDGFPPWMTHCRF